jgi:adenosylcobyric acid synthase
MLRSLTGRPVLGTVPWLEGLWLDAEDSLSAGPDALLGRARPPVGAEWLSVAAVRLPRISNTTDLDALAAEPGVRVQLVADAASIAAADLVVLPGSKSTADDLAWLRRQGLADAVIARVAAGGPVLGICGGYQMLAQTITDDVECRAGTVDGLGLLPVRISFAPDKTLANVTGFAYRDVPVAGYEIHHGREAWREQTLAPMFTLPGGGAEGASLGVVRGTHWHGAFESDVFRRAFLREVAAACGRTGFRVSPDVEYARVRSAALDVLADAVDEHLDTDALLRLIEQGPSSGLPFVPPGAPCAPA